MVSVAPSPVNPNWDVNLINQRLARLVLRLMGWQVVDWEMPDNVQKVIVIGEHHTSNMDGFLMVFMSAAMGRKLAWLVKEELNKPIIGAMIRASGGIFVDRHASKGTVGQVVDIINDSERIFLVLAPSGTRKKTDKWRSGFYYMALGADVPIALGYLDYAKKEGGIGKIIMPTGNIKTDEAVFREFFADVTARFPDQTSAVRLDPPPKLPTEVNTGDTQT